jgi:tetratricopeptide (TPR) repeat protein
MSAIFLISIGSINCFSITRQEYVNTLLHKANSYNKKGNYDVALISINKAIKLQPKRSQLYYKRAMIIGRSGNYHQAIKELSQFIKNKNYPHAIRFRADCFMAVNQMEKSVKDYTRFLKHAPKDGKVWSYLVEALALMGKRESALDAIRHGLATGSHWSKRLTFLQKQILLGKPIIPHTPFSN